jgi:AbrB family looped-hinge helix DNA binding protein
MPEATITSKGQITIPKAVREALKLKPGDRIDFIQDEQGQIILTPIKTSVDEMYGILHRPGQPQLSPEDMDAAIRKKVSS